MPLVDQGQVDGWNGLKSRGNRGMELVGHLKGGVTPAQATSDLNAVAAYLKKTYPKDDDGMGFKLARPGLVGDMMGGPVRAFLAGLMALAGLILLAACANLGSLFAARAADRSREIALRLALGSSRKRILRQLFTEAVMVSLMGGAAGLLGERGAAALAERVAAGVEFSDTCASEPGCARVWGRVAAGAGERPTVRRGSGAAGAARESL